MTATKRPLRHNADNDFGVIFAAIHDRRSRGKKRGASDVAASDATAPQQDFERAGRVVGQDFPCLYTGIGFIVNGVRNHSGFATPLGELHAEEMNLVRHLYGQWSKNVRQLVSTQAPQGANGLLPNLATIERVIWKFSSQTFKDGAAFIATN